MSKIDEMDEERKQAFDALNTPERIALIKKNAQNLVDSWNYLWKIYLGAIREGTGMTLAEAMQYEQMITWNDMIRHSRAMLKEMEGHEKDDWQKPDVE